MDQVLSNTKSRIAELRRKITSLKGKSNRAYATANELRYRAQQYDQEMRRAKDEIRSMGGVIRD